MSSECVSSGASQYIMSGFSYELNEKTEAFYTGGAIQLSGDGRYVLTTCGSAVKVLSVDTGRVEKTIEEVREVEQIM